MFYNDFKRFGDAIAIKYYSSESNNLVQISYEELGQRIDQFKSLISINHKSVILLNIDNSLESIVALYGVLGSGHAAILVDDKNLEFQNKLLEQYSVDFHYKKANEIWQLSVVDRMVGNGSDINEELALLLSTSGSTGSPKCVKLSYENIAANTESICAYLPIDSTHISALILPIHYSYGLSVINTHLAKGASIFVGKLSVVQPDFIAFLEREKITSLAGVPYTFALLEMIKFRDAKLPQLKYITQAGGRLTPRTVTLYNDWAKKQGVEFYVMYGQTEATARIAYVPPNKLDEFSHCIGVAIPGGQLQIWNENEEPVTNYDEPGELVYSGPNVMMGYAETRADLNTRGIHSYLKTGDIGCRNSDELFYIIGRKKRFSKLYGMRFNLDDIEKYFDSIGEAAICTSDDEFLYIASENIISEDSLKKITEHYGIGRSHVVYYKVDKFPVFVSGKYDYDCLLSLGKQQRKIDLESSTADLSVSHTDCVPPRTSEEERICAIWKDILKVEHVDVHDNFFELGGSSLSAVECLSRLRHEFHMDIEASDFFGSNDIHILAERIRGLALVDFKKDKELVHRKYTPQRSERQKSSNLIVSLTKKILRHFAFEYGKLIWFYKKLCNPDGTDWAMFLMRRDFFFAMGQDCSIGTDVLISDPKLVRLGNNVRLTGCSLFCHDGGANLINTVYGTTMDAVGVIDIKDNVLVNYQAIITRGVTIGPDAIVAAGSVVSRNVPPNSIVAGNPAEVVGTFEDYKALLEFQNMAWPWKDLIKQRGAAFDWRMEPELLRLRSQYFFGDT